MRTVLTHGICFVILIVINFLDPPVTPPPTPPPPPPCILYGKSCNASDTCCQSGGQAKTQCEFTGSSYMCYCSTVGKECTYDSDCCYGEGCEDHGIGEWECKKK